MIIAQPAAATSKDAKLEAQDLKPDSSPADNSKPKTQHSRLASGQDAAKGFLDEIPTDIRKLEGKVRGLWEGGTPAARHEMLGDIYMDVHTIAEDAGKAGLGLISSIASQIEALLAKVYQDSRLASRSVWETASAALTLLADLCANPLSNGSGQREIRMLVVDDDPISRRAISNAVQLRFGKPDSAEDGEAAARLAAQKPYDVIFMDARMPSMDGFTSCSIIRKTALNFATPVVFVTSSTDLESQAKCSLSGGNAFISKPVFPAQIALAAVIFGLRGQMEKKRSEAAARHAN
jgi:CheY-like chemotaxis protein